MESTLLKYFHSMIEKPIEDSVFFNESQFRLLLDRERKRSERTKNPLLFVVANISRLLRLRKENRTLIEKIRQILSASSREIDIRGWYRTDTEVGIIYTDIQPDSANLIIEKVKDNFKKMLGAHEATLIDIRSVLLPLKDGKSWVKSPVDERTFFGDSQKTGIGETIQRTLKRSLDVSVSLTLLVILAPLFAIVAAIVKATSRGPVFFHQERIGRNGSRFMMHKFRSMKANCDPALHKQYAEQLIKGTAAKNGQVYKIKNDPRLTIIGGFLRKSSIDELPQLFNVLIGEMTLVGPRPPIAYEVEAYDIWHCRRVVASVPGITGFWQVEGRSHTTFDEMVRMDIRYQQEWSFWLDLKLLMKTPAAVLMGKGAC